MAAIFAFSGDGEAQLGYVLKGIRQAEPCAKFAFRGYRRAQAALVAARAHALQIETELAARARLPG
jgi:hypothetical protein